jgi:hypothetical protein
MVTLNDSRSVVLRHVLNIAGDVLDIKKESWFDTMIAGSTKDDWYLTEKLNKDWIECAQTVEDESKLYSSVEYALDICKCYTHYTRGSINATIRGILDIREKIPGFADDWTFVDYFGGIGLSSIYFAQQLTAAGINARVVYHNSDKNVTQVALAKRFYEEFGAPSNMSMHLTDDQPVGDCYMFYEVFEHIREPWDFVKHLFGNHTPKCVIHASRFNLPLVSGHFKNYKIDGLTVSGKIATREFERKFKTAKFVRTVIPQEFNGIPRFQLHESVIPSNITVKNCKWDLKKLKKLGLT